MATQDIQELKNQLAASRKELYECMNQNQQLQTMIGGNALKGWRPQPQIERQYGWLYAWLYPLNSYLNSHMDKQINPDIRNDIVTLVSAIILQLVMDGKYGLKVPLEPREVDSTLFAQKQDASFRRAYAPCEICGEKRITHGCHIVPRAEGGPYSTDNFVNLCPLHHHLFDHHRLSQEEWNTLSRVIEGKSETANLYAREIRLASLRNFWNQQESR